jgi:hypothetical protein
MIRPPSLKSSFPPPKIFHTRILSPSLGKIHGGRTVSRRRGASNIDDAELRGGFLENSVTEDAMVAKLKMAATLKLAR